MKFAQNMASPYWHSPTKNEGHLVPGAYAMVTMATKGQGDRISNKHLFVVWKSHDVYSLKSSSTFADYYKSLFSIIFTLFQKYHPVCSIHFCHLPTHFSNLSWNPFWPRLQRIFSETGQSRVTAVLGRVPSPLKHPYPLIYLLVWN